MGKILKFKIPEKYWLCTGSTDAKHDSRCIEAKKGHPERCVYGTEKEHRVLYLKNHIQLQ